MKRIALTLGFLGVGGLGLFWFLTQPDTVADVFLVGIENGDGEKGERIFWAGGCSSCHADKTAKGEDRLKLGGRHPLKTPFGIFYTPNISPDQTEGIGAWSGRDFANAMTNGVSPDGSHYYPAFPYTTYSRIKPVDLADLWAFMKSLPPIATENVPHELPLPFRFRRGLGLWKLLYLRDEPVTQSLNNDPVVEDGRYIVEALAHCGECHTPRNLIGGMKTSRWLGGGPSPEGKGRIPNISPHATGIGDWTLKDITYSLETGFTREFDSFGGAMASVQENMAKLTPADREAIAVYLKNIPAVASPPKNQE
jgi:mono/diheme cytochrome c family protein